MSVAVQGDSFLEQTDFQHCAVIPVYVSGPSISLNLRKLNCIHNTRMAFLCKLCVQSPHQGSRAPYQDCRLLIPPYTNIQDPRPFMITHAHSVWVSLINVGGDKARPIPQISFTIALMVPIWTLSNPLQCLTSPTKSGVGVGVGDRISWLISVDHLCQQWLRKLIVSYLHQYQTFLVKTAMSEYAMPSYY